MRVCHVYGKGLRAYVGIVCRHRVSFGVPGEGDREGEGRGVGRDQFVQG